MKDCCEEVVYTSNFAVSRHACTSTLLGRLIVCGEQHTLERVEGKLVLPNVFEGIFTTHTVRPHHFSRHRYILQPREISISRKQQGNPIIRQYIVVCN